MILIKNIYTGANNFNYFCEVSNLKNFYSVLYWGHIYHALNKMKK